MKIIKRGLSIPIAGSPRQEIDSSVGVSRVGLLSADYIGMKPTMLVQVGDRVKLGQPLFVDKKTEGVTYTSPGAGTVAEVRRGNKRAFQGVVISLDGGDAVEFEPLARKGVSGLTRQAIVELLTRSGLWTALRTRPYGKVASPASEPSSIFVSAIDTNPLAADPAVVLRDRQDHFTTGMHALTKLAKKVFLCKALRAAIPGGDLPGVHVEEFAGAHPAGLPGTHIHLLDPVGAKKTVWYIGYQDVAAIGYLMSNGILDPRRIISLAGPVVKTPRLIETRLGASIAELCRDELSGDNLRVISGSILCGRKAVAPVEFLGRYHVQVSALQEGNQRDLLGWMSPGHNKFSLTRVFTSALRANPRFNMTTSSEGSERAMVPLGTYERVVPLDMMPTQLLRALIVRDTESAQALGALELEEEDLALCTFVCPGKYDYGTILRDNLTRIELEG
jgi:Na+-transporting NADH:ubiquinone oxidoreductase subunit A